VVSVEWWCVSIIPGIRMRFAASTMSVFGGKLQALPDRDNFLALYQDLAILKIPYLGIHAENHSSPKEDWTSIRRLQLREDSRRWCGRLRRGITRRYQRGSGRSTDECQAPFQEAASRRALLCWRVDNGFRMRLPD
jgi:hypothetical protein